MPVPLRTSALWSSSLRAKLLLLVVLALVPAFALIAWVHYDQLRNERAEITETARRIAVSRAAEFGAKIAELKALTAMLADFPVVRGDPRLPLCSQVVAGMKRQLPHVGNLGVADGAGRVVCSAVPFDPARPTEAGDRLWFRRTLESRGFSMGEYLVGRLTGLHIVTFGHPVTNIRGELAGVAFVSLDLSWLPRFVADLTLPKGSALLVLNREGRILARYPDHDAWVGKMHPLAEARLAAVGRDIVSEGGGLDGVRRFYAHAPIPGSDGQMTVFFGLPKAAAEASVYRRFALSLGLMAAILLTGFLLAWLGAEIWVLRRTHRLSVVTERLAAGDLDARSGVVAADEIGRLAASFDYMADMVSGRERELERRVAERTRELEVSNDQLAQASRLKSDFLASMSHELRTPLNAIIGFAEVLHDGLAGEVDARQREYLRDILDSGTHLLSLINDILDLSKVESGKMSLDLECLPVETNLRAALSIVREKALARRLTLEQDLAPDIGDLCADLRKFKQIAYNLLSNAVKFTPDGGRVTLAARRVASAAVPDAAAVLAGAAEFLEIAVCDTGIGISAEDQQKLFAPFQQIDSSLARQYAGTGLGLALVKRLVELHGGAVGLESVPGWGTTFRVWLPYRPACDGAAARDRQAGVPGAPRQAGRCVLVVEDDAASFELLRLAFESHGFSVARAVDARAAHGALERETPDLITLDILMPGEDGWQFLDALKRNADWAHIPVVVVSIVADEKIGAALGASAVLRKPLRKEDLRRMLDDLGFGAERAAGLEECVDLIEAVVQTSRHSNATLLDEVHHALGQEKEAP